MQEEQIIISLSRKLIADTESALIRYEKSKQDGVRGDFHTEVKPFADEVQNAALRWKEAAASWVDENQPKNLHAKQIETAADYLEVISVQAFFPETSRKRFLDQVQSVLFILNSMILAIENSTDVK